MKKKILVLSSSPRRGGNSDVLSDQFIRGAKESGHEVEKVFLKDKTINYCIGCNVCQENGGVCVQKDDMTEIGDKMIAADVIVMATPVYFYTMCAQMKTLIDRTCPQFKKIKDTEFYYILAAVVEDVSLMERVIDSFRGFTRCLSNPIEKGVIYGMETWDVGDVKDKASMKDAYEMGKSV